MKKIFTLVLTAFIALTSFSQIRISQVYGAGGNTGAAYNQDYVEIYNAGAAAASLDGWSIQYASATGGTGNWAVDSFPNGTSIGAGKYLLVALATGANGVAIPTPDQTNTGINLAASAGKVALASSQTPLSGTTACGDASVVDMIGYGATATCAEGLYANTNGLDNTEALYRLDNGCIDFNNNNVDFFIATASPRNSATAANVCSNNPLITASDTTGLVAVFGGTPATGSFTMYAVNLTGAQANLTVNSLSTNFSISLTPAGTFANSLSIPYASAAAFSVTIYVRTTPTAPLGAINGDVEITGGGTADTASISGNMIVAEPTVQASNIVTSTITDTSMTINWANGNGGNRIVVMHAANTTTTLPADTRSYTASLDLRAASSLGAANYVVFNGTGGGPINVIGLQPGITYTISVYEYDSSGAGTQNYLTTTATNNPVTATTIGLSSNLTQVNFTGLAVPLYTGSGTATRLPTLYYARLSNLAPNTTYRYFTQAAIATDFGAAAGGAGNPVLFDYTVSPVTYSYVSTGSLSNAGAHGKFTTDASGSFQGSFGFVNTGNSRFSAGVAIYPSITLAADPSTTAQYRFALNQSITVLTYATTPGANNGSFIQGSSLATPGNFVALWDNVNATGRPLAMTLAENPTFAGSVAWGTSFVPGYSTTAGSWNTIIPNDNANGVRLIQQFNMITGDVIGCDSDADGTWPTGTVVTSNPTGGTLTTLQIALADAPLNGGNCFNVIPVKLEYINGHKTNSGNALNWRLTCLSSGVTMQVERSGDTRNFKSIASITATQARCAEPFNYVDGTPLKGRNFYRLKMTDTEGKVSYSPVVMVNNGGSGVEIVGLYPSVVKNKTTASVSSDKAAAIEIRVTDMSGRIISKNKYNLAAGSNLINIDCEKLAAGLYNFTGIATDGISTTIRFVKL
jgi:hypothetical protein